MTSAWVLTADKANTPGTYTLDVDTTVDNNLLTTQATQDYTVYIKSYLVDYTDVKTYTSKTI